MVWFNKNNPLSKRNIFFLNSREPTVKILKHISYTIYNTQNRDNYRYSYNTYMELLTKHFVSKNLFVSMLPRKRLNMALFPISLICKHASLGRLRHEFLAESILTERKIKTTQVLNMKKNISYWQKILHRMQIERI